MKKIYIIAGEASGDMYGAHLIDALKKQSSEALEIRCWGGDRMEAAGATLVKHYRDLAFMGFAEVILNLRTILGNIKYCKADLLDFQPDAVVMIDYPGFNLRIAKFLKKLDIPVHYYVSPQIWAWKESRISAIKRDVDFMYTILPFEKDFYAKHNTEVDFVGHPLIDELAQQPSITPADFKSNHGLSSDPIIALLPGSRKQEIDRILPVMLEALAGFNDHQFVLAAAPSLPDSLLEHYTKNYPVQIVQGATHDLLRVAKAGIITSGTATLEAALHGLPQVICYKANTISYIIAKRLVKIKYIALANLIMDKEVVRELIQGDCNPKQIAAELNALMNDSERQVILQNDYAALREKLGSTGASSNVAKLLLKRIE